MKLKLTLLLISFLCINSYSQRIVETIKSKKVNADREIQIILPRGYEEKQEQKFPLLVVLDADYLIAPTASNIRYGVNFDEYLDFIIIGINQATNNDRVYDSEFEDTGIPSVNGGAFYEFITQEVVPYIESKYRVQPFRAIMGHGVTAGFINAFLYKDVPFFNAFIAMSPILATNMETNVASSLSALKKPVFYYLSDTDGDLPEEKVKINLLNQNIKAIKNENLNYKFEHFPEGNHYSYALQAIPSALNFIFKGYGRIDMEEFNNKIMVLESGHAQYLMDKYEKIENKYGFTPTIRLSDFEAIEAAIVKKGNSEELIPLAKLAEKHYPETMLGAYHLALYEEKMDDWGRAEKAYLKAFSLNPVRNLTKNMMIDRADYFKEKLKEHKEMRESERKKNKNQPLEEAVETTTEEEVFSEEQASQEEN